MAIVDHGCRSQPQRPVQEWLRRSPPKGTLTVEERARRADERLRKTLEMRRELMERAMAKDPKDPLVGTHRL